jgi:hypothetical protein
MIPSNGHTYSFRESVSAASQCVAGSVSISVSLLFSSIQLLVILILKVVCSNFAPSYLAKSVYEALPVAVRGAGRRQRAVVGVFATWSANDADRMYDLNCVSTRNYRGSHRPHFFILFIGAGKTVRAIAVIAITGWYEDEATHCDRCVEAEEIELENVVSALELIISFLMIRCGLRI